MFYSIITDPYSQMHTLTHGQLKNTMPPVVIAGGGTISYKG